MAVKKLTSTTSMQIEIEHGVDSKGKTVYRKKTFANVREDVDLQKVFDVASAMKTVIDANTRNVLLSETSKIVSEA